MAKKNKPEILSEPAAISLAIQYPVTELGAPQKKKTTKSNKVQPHYAGHRDRLRERFIESKGEGFADYELLELLLFRSISRADTKPIAKALIHHFGSLAELLAADIARIQEVRGCGPALALDLKIIHKITESVLKANFNKRNIFSSWDKVLAYLKVSMGHEMKEQFRVLFLDKKNGLIKNEIQQVGTVDHTPVYPREVIRRALELGASSIILVHNHPSGDPHPSKEDISMTAKLKEIADAFNITIHDHIIIGRLGYTSFKALQLL